MKIHILSLVMLLSLDGAAMPSTNAFWAVTNDWYNANFTNVYELAVARMSADTNDVVAAYLMFDWNVCFADISAVSGSVSRVIELSDRVTNSIFRTRYGQLRGAFVSYRDEFLPTADDGLRTAERYKSFLPHKEMPSTYMLNLLNDVNLW